MSVDRGECRRRGRRHSSTSFGQRTSTCRPDIACSVYSRSGENSNCASVSDTNVSPRRRTDHTGKTLSGLAGRPYSRHRTSYTILSTRISHTCQLSVIGTESPSFSSRQNLRPRRRKSPSFEHRLFFSFSGHHFVFIIIIIIKCTFASQT